MQVQVTPVPRPRLIPMDVLTASRGPVGRVRVSSVSGEEDDRRFPRHYYLHTSVPGTEDYGHALAFVACKKGTHQRGVGSSRRAWGGEVDQVGQNVKSMGKNSWMDTDTSGTYYSTQVTLPRLYYCTCST